MKKNLKKIYFQNFGIGLSSLINFSKNLGLNNRNYFAYLKRSQVLVINKWIVKITYNGKLINNINNNITFYKKIKIYRGLRHLLQYPVRGQRTHTNAQTVKSTRFLNNKILSKMNVFTLSNTDINIEDKIKVKKK